MKSHRILTLAALISTAALTLTACGGGASSSSSGGSAGSQLKIGVVVRTMSNPVWQAVASGAEDQAKKAGNVTVKTVGADSESDVTGQINKVQDLISSGVNALIVAPNGGPQLKPILEQAAAKGVKIVIIDNDIPDLKGKVSYVGTNQPENAAAVNKEIITSLGAEAKGAEVGILDYPGNTVVQARVDAAKKTFEDAGLNVVSVLPGKCDRATAQNSATDMITAHPNIKAIFGSCGQGATGAAQAAQNAGKKILVTGFDGTNDEFRTIKAGNELATILQDFKGTGAQAMTAAIDSASGKSVQSNYDVPATLITKDNVDKFQPAG
ncbi:MAG: sugar ABC transporter substrate-binding protein [Actinomycetota bacterium]|nr:sugar ABC transporter substrate-binding protein [Actinomycetota bacterium]